MRTPLAIALLAAALAGCDSSEPPKPPTVTEPVKPMAQAPSPAPVESLVKAPPSAPAPSADELLAARVKRLLRDTRLVEGQGVDPSVDGGVVTLYGTAPSRAESAAIGKFVADIDGVASVVNKLVVVQGS